MKNATEEPTTDEALRAVVARLARPHRSGGSVIERAAILAEGADFAAVMNWIDAHDGAPDELASATRGGGLHGSRMTGGNANSSRPPLRFVLPPGALD